MQAINTIVTEVASEVRPIVDVADAGVHVLTSVLDKLKAIVDNGDLSQVGAAIDAVKEGVPTIVNAMTEGTPAAASPQS